MIIDDFYEDLKKLIKELGLDYENLTPQSLELSKLIEEKKGKSK